MQSQQCTNLPKINICIFYNLINKIQNKKDQMNIVNTSYSLKFSYQLNYNSNLEYLGKNTDVD